MWLLDVNIPQRLFQVLARLGITAETAVYRGWRNLRNGDLVRAAASSGFTCILTRDRLFAESAARALVANNLSIVVVALPQLREADFLMAFEEAWQREAI